MSVVDNPVRPVQGCVLPVVRSPARRRTTGRWRFSQVAGAAERRTARCSDARFDSGHEVADGGSERGGLLEVGEMAAVGEGDQL